MVHLKQSVTNSLDLCLERENTPAMFHLTYVLTNHMPCPPLDRRIVHALSPHVFSPAVRRVVKRYKASHQHNRAHLKMSYNILFGLIFCSQGLPNHRGAMQL